MKTKLFFFTSLLLATLSACQSDEPSSDTDETIVAKELQDIPLTASEIELTNKTMDFSLTLFNQTCQQIKDKNLMVSPLGAAALLNLMANGSNGSTANEIYAALSPNGYNAKELNDFYAKLITWLPELDNTTTVAQAYSVWIDNEFSIKTDYANFAKSTLDAEVYVKNLSQSQQDINQWCAKKTNGCIKDINCSLKDAKTLLLNALYFKGTWANKFDVSQTKEEKFYGTGQTSTVPMMHNKQIAGRYATNEHFTAVSLPYGNEAYSMMLILPTEDIDMVQAGDILAGGAWKELSTQLIGTKIDLKLPKFELSYEISLIETLKEMNIKEAFTDNANFSKMTNNNIYFNVFKQKSFISIDEKGTEASSTTWVGTDGANSEEGNSTTLTVSFNRPFFFVVQEKSTGLILFMGKIEHL
ncbi:serpin family protein [Phocaeicola faecalis]